MTSFTLRSAASATWMTASRFSAAILGAGVLAATLAPGMAFADATPVELVLLYMPHVSTTGTTAASGIAELVMPEGEVRITAAGLPRLDGDNQYVAWVVNSDSNQFQRVGDFNSTQETGAVHYENVLPDAIPNNHWNLLLLTVEDNASADHPSSDHSLAAVFPNAQNAPLPGILPNTGGLPDDAVISGGLSATRWSTLSDQWSVTTGADRMLVAGLLALIFAMGCTAGYVSHRQRVVLQARGPLKAEG
jgi:hypothetical protein